MATPTDMSVYLSYGATNSAGTAASNKDLSALGLFPINPYDIVFKHEDISIPEQDGIIALRDGYLGASRMTLQSQLFSGNDADDLRETIEDVNVFLWKMARSDWRGQYVRLGLHDGSSIVQRRRYCVPLGAHYPIQRKTRFFATQTAVTLDFIATDPAWYDLTPETETINAVAGTGNVLINPVVGNLDCSRYTVKIFNNTASQTPTDVTVSGTNGSFQMTGNLAAINDYWLIDSGWGTVTKVVVSPASTTDDIGNFSGEFFAIDDPTDLITTTDTDTSTYDVIITYLPRYM
jgi:hypothetical protein